MGPRRLGPVGERETWRDRRETERQRETWRERVMERNRNTERDSEMEPCGSLLTGSSRGERDMERETRRGGHGERQRH